MNVVAQPGIGISGLEALVARRRPGHSLEAAFYTSQEVLDLDLRLIFGQHWIFVGSEPELPEPGDYVTVQIGGTSVILVRDDSYARITSGPTISRDNSSTPRTCRPASARPSMG